VRKSRKLPAYEVIGAHAGVALVITEVFSKWPRTVERKLLSNDRARCIAALQSRASSDDGELEPIGRALSMLSSGMLATL